MISGTAQPVVTSTITFLTIARPFLGASLGGVYGDGVKDSGFAGLETGIKYYVRTKTYFLARAEYQFLFSSTDEATDAFQDDGIWAYTIGMGYNF